MRLSKLFRPKGVKFNDNKNKNGIEGTMSNIEDYLVVWFEGSNAIWDWVINLICLKLFSFLTEGFHSGWYSEAKDFYESEKSKSLREEIEANDKIIFCSYSKGSGNIKPFLWFMKDKLKGKRIYFVEFGAPNACSKKSLKELNEYFAGVYSYKNGGDIVTTVPYLLAGNKKIQLGKKKFISNSIKDHLEYKKILKGVEWKPEL